jgi:FtsP/CotA-like multicopper oxidase with cupredoxin domain
MRFAPLLLAASLLPHHAPAHVAPGGNSPVARVAPNDNRASAGVLRDGVLTVRLEAREGEWRPDGDDAPGVLVHAFGEAGHPTSVPGPLLRVREGTEIRAHVTNTLASGTLVVRGLSPRGVSGRSADSLAIPSGETRDVRFLAGAPGTYYYRGEVVGGVAHRESIDAELSGAFGVDPREGPPARDRILVIALWRKVAAPFAIVRRTDVLRFTINGRTWPNTERLAYTVGDTVRFRVVNVSDAVHPMHLHGFYFDVWSRGEGTIDSAYASDEAPRVVTERVAPGRTFTMTWVPERAGNWLFHCHDNFHVLRNAPIDGAALPAEETVHAKNHALEMMGGLVMGIEVRPRAGDAPVVEPAPRRRLWLVARTDSGSRAAEPFYGYELHDGARVFPSRGPLLPGPTILLKRGEPVSITVRNELPEPTAVHWHGIELQSYYDGVANFSGIGRHITPAIAPGDSFEARFTPPRSGTFMYHPHADEVRQQQAGLAGAIVVVDDPARFDAEHDRVVLLTVPRRGADRDHVLINGSLDPAPLELHTGERYRLRVIDIHVYRPSMVVRLLRDTTPVRWRAVAKDGMDLPDARATMRPAIQQMGNGETYDYELIATEPGELRLVVSSAAGVPLASLPLVVR